MADSEKGRLVVKVSGDWQIWVVIGDLPGGERWRLPVRVLPFRAADGSDVFFVRKEMEFSASQYSSICPVLDSHDICPKDERGWWFRSSGLDKIAIKAAGITFEHYIQWAGYEPPPPVAGNAPDLILVEPERGFSARETEFLKRLQLVCGDLSFDSLKHVWLSIRKEAANWLAVERKTLDLGFARLVPVPYRQNWKEALCVRFSSLLHVMRRPKAEWKLDSLGLHGALASLKLFAIDRQHRFMHWTIELLPSAELERAVNEEENAAFTRLGPAAYANRILSKVARHLSEILEVIKHYTEAVNVPTPISVTGNRGSLVLISDPKGTRVRPGKGLCEHLDIVVTDAMETFTDCEENRQETQKAEGDERTYHALFREEGFIDVSPDTNPSRALTQGDEREPNSRYPDVETPKEVASNKNIRCDRNGEDQSQAAPPDDTAAAPDCKSDT